MSEARFLFDGGLSSQLGCPSNSLDSASSITSAVF